jgi:hypothetical protein
MHAAGNGMMPPPESTIAAVSCHIPNLSASNAIIDMKAV